MEFYLPTRYECREIVKLSEAFYVTEREVNGFKVEMYDYRLASIVDFRDNKAFELRGLTFVYNPDNGVWERNLLMEKFFNVNQTEGWMYGDLRDKKIVRVQDKLDGSIISFVRFPDGVIRPKSKMSFESEQALMAKEIFLKNKCLRQFIVDCFTANLTPIFELVSPFSQVVLEYSESELVLLQIRKEDGTYFDSKKMKIYADNYCIGNSLPVSKDFDLKELEKETDLLGENNILGTLLWHKKNNTNNIEGWVITFEDGMKAKVKTDHYLQLHGLIGPDAFRENLLIKTILDGNIDDVLGNLTPGPKKDRILEIEKIVNKKFNHLVVEFKMLRGEFYNKYNENRKEFALDNRKHPLFGIVMKNLHGKMSEVEKIAENAITEYIRKQTNSLGNAREWLEE